MSCGDEVFEAGRAAERAVWVARGDALLADYVAKRDARNDGSVAWFELNAVAIALAHYIRVASGSGENE